MRCSYCGDLRMLTADQRVAALRSYCPPPRPCSILPLANNRAQDPTRSDLLVSLVDSGFEQAVIARDLRVSRQRTAQARQRVRERWREFQ